MSTEKQEETFFAPIADFLDQEEVGFVERVMKNSGCKMKEAAWSEDGKRALWLRPEKLGLIRSVGSYAWMPAAKITLCFRARFESTKPISL